MSEFRFSLKEHERETEQKKNVLEDSYFIINICYYEEHFDIYCVAVNVFVNLLSLCQCISWIKGADNEMIPLSMTVSSGMFVFVSHCFV